jgi:hypothetical protein
LHLCRTELLVNQHINREHAAEVRKQAAKIVQLRNEHGLTVRQLSQRFGVNITLIKEILRGAK